MMQYKFSDHDVDAIKHITALYGRQRAAFAADPVPSAVTRRANLAHLCRALTRHGDRLAAAVRADFGYRSDAETMILELTPALRAARYASANLGAWMRPERRSTPVYFGFGRARVVRHPVGVVGIIAPWNYPILLAIRPLIGALAAGNRVMIKMSERVPSTSIVLADVLREFFALERVAVVTGGIEAARVFASQPFDHLFFTGSRKVGREVLMEAARRLTPVTLELGGKTPAIIAPDYSARAAADSILWGKCANAGQTCVAPDYVLLPQGNVEAFVEEAHRAVQELYPLGAASSDYGAVIDDKSYHRLRSLIDDAAKKGARVVELFAGPSTDSRKMSPTILTDVTEDMDVMKEEIFGPLLPLIGYRQFEEAVAFVARRDVPLAVYVFDRNRSRIDALLRVVRTGGITINNTLIHAAIEELPLGGVAASGIGRYHGRDGFETFSSRKAVFHQSRVNWTRLLRPPFGFAAKLAKWSVS